MISDIMIKRLEFDDQGVNRSIIHFPSQIKIYGKNESLFFLQLRIIIPSQFLDNLNTKTRSNY
ncbi:hypothetical protein pb186bvf_000318 [Paramecium bursaria]